MIIRYPTGLYSDILPHNESDTDSVTYTISMTAPPRTNLSFQKLPNGIASRQRVNVLNIDREDLGELIFSISSATRTDNISNKKQYEYGQILEFGEIDIDALDQMLIPNITETQHNNNKFDYDIMGLSSNEQNILSKQSTLAQTTLSKRLNELKELRANVDAKILDLQRLINETDKTIKALEVLQDVSSNNDVASIIIKLRDNLDSYYNDRRTYTLLANEYASDAEDVMDQIRTISSIVR